MKKIIAALVLTTTSSAFALTNFVCTSPDPSATSYYKYLTMTVDNRVPYGMRVRYGTAPRTSGMTIVSIVTSDATGNLYQTTRGPFFVDANVLSEQNGIVTWAGGPFECVLK